MTTRIRIDGLRKEFTRGSRHAVAVNHIDLTIDPGEIFFLLGPSGCGKTTLLRMIAGFITPTAGRLYFDESEVTELPPNRRGVGMVFQSYALWPHMSVLENVAFGLRAQGVSGSEVDRRSIEALDVVRMREYSDRKPNELSGGQQQRVALARALVVRPRVLLLDEPLSNLDAKLRSELRSEIKRVCKESAITTIYVTHDQKEALAIADRIAVLDKGSLRQVGSAEKLYYEPTSRFVATFLGELNVYAGRCIEVDAESIHIECGLGPLRARRLPSMPVQVGDSVSIGIRPESIMLAPRSDAAEINRIPVSGFERTFLGEYTVFDFKVGNDRLIAHCADFRGDVDSGHGGFDAVFVDSDHVMVIGE